MPDRSAPFFAHLAAALAAVGGLFGGFFAEAPAVAPEAVEAVIRERAAALPLHEDTRALYAADGYRARWTAQGEYVALYRALAAAPTEGLPDTLVHADVLAGLSVHLAALREAPPSDAPSKRPDPRAVVLAEADLLLTDGLLRYADALLGRRVEPDSLYPNEWHAARRPDAALIPLRVAIRSGDARAAATALEGLRPRHPEYAALRGTLARLRAAAPSWATIPAGEPLRVGDHSIRVPHLRGRLAAFGYLPDEAGGWGTPDPFHFDSLLAGALARFQADAELPVDSLLTPDLTARLNQDLEAVVRAVVLNLERWRWLPDDLGDLHVIANLPAYELAVREADGGRWHEALRMPAAIGLANGWTTPILSDSIVSVVFDPTWYVPASIAAASIVPRARADSTSLGRAGFTVYQGGARVDPLQVPWDSVSAGAFRFVQRPGPGNPLGRLKFVMPNVHAVLIHDTNKPSHFALAQRAVSTGCVQASDAPALARVLLGAVNGWPAGAVPEAMARWGERSVPLDRPVPVHFVYFTAWPEADGRLRLFGDVYGHDAVLAVALDIAPASVEAAEAASAEAGG